MKPDHHPPLDRAESVTLIEPMRLAEGSAHRQGLADLALELAAQSAGFRRSLPIGVFQALADLVRAMNCYYSNLIEGHNTHPVEIERALKNEYSANAEKLNLQREARAHIAVQQWIDAGGLGGCAISASSRAPLRLAFPARLASHWMPGLFPEHF